MQLKSQVVADFGNPGTKSDGNTGFRACVELARTLSAAGGVAASDARYSGTSAPPLEGYQATKTLGVEQAPVLQAEECAHDEL